MKTLFTNAVIYSPDKLKADTIAVYDGRILEIGSKTNLLSLKRRGFKVIDLMKKTVLPGFIDSHVHLLSTGYSLMNVNLDDLDSLDKAVAKIKKAAARRAAGRWLLGRGWNKNLWGIDFPDKKILDQACPDSPAAFYSKDGHSLWANSAALQYAGITASMPDPDGGKIMRDAAGEPTGILFETATELLMNRVPEPTADLKMRALKMAVSHFNKFGITGVGDCDWYANRLNIFRQGREKNQLNLRVFMMLAPDDVDSAVRLGLKTGFGDDFITTGCLKLYMDGALGSQTAWMHSAYEGRPDNFGMSTLTGDELEMYFEKTHMSGIGLAIHAIGDRANSEVLAFFAKKYAVSKKLGLKHRIEHVQLLRRNDISKFNRYNISASVQPVHIISDRDMADEHWGKRSEYAYPLGMLLQAGARLGFGSDCPIENPNPMLGIYAAVCRKRPGDTRTAWYTKQCISLGEAVKAYTTGAADICGWQGKTGVLAPGARADLVVLSDDIFKTKIDSLPEVAVLATIIDGQVVHKDGAFKL